MEIELKYNPFITKVEEFKADGKPDSLECWGETGEKPIDEWLLNFYEKLHYKYNKAVYHIVFKGIQSDFEKLEDATENFKLKNNNIDIKLEQKGNFKNPEDRLSELKELFENMQKETPFEQLKTKEMKNIFNKAVSSDFEIAVVATMSSGKSTLINAMLGKEILPSGNAAATARIARIHDDDNATDFSAKSYDREGKLLSECNKLSLEDMNKLNSNSDTDRIEIFGNIEGVSSQNLKLVLTDTPGPDNSETTTHREHTERLLNADYKPMILYVFDTNGVKKDSDADFLDNVSNAMKSGGRQAKDRFIFVLNKADLIGHEHDINVQNVIKSMKGYLENHQIKNAKIFLCNSFLAKIIRQYLGNQKLTDDEEDSLEHERDVCIKREWRHFSDVSPLSPEMKEIQDKMIEKAKSNSDSEKGKYQEALVYTGIPAVELAINEYLNKYALPAKVAEGVSSFKSKIDSLKLEADTTKKISEDKTELDKRLNLIDEIQKQLEDGKKKDDILEKIDSVSAKQDFNDGYDSIYSEAYQTLRDFENSISNEVSPDEAQEMLLKLNGKLSDIQIKLKVNLENLLNNVLVSQIKLCVADYKKYLSSLLGDVDYETPAIVLGDLGDMTVEDTLYAYKQEREVEDGYHMEKNQDKKWYKPWTWFEPSKIKVINYRTENFIDFNDFIKNEVEPKFDDAVESMKQSALDEAVNQESQFKSFFKSKLSDLDLMIQNKLKEQQSAFSDKEKFEKLIEENKKNLAWLKEFIGKLDSIIAV